MYEIECFWSFCWSGNIPALSLFFYQRLTIAIFLTSFFFPNSFWRVDYHIPPLSAPPSLPPLPPPAPQPPHKRAVTRNGVHTFVAVTDRTAGGFPQNTSPYPPFLFTPPPVPTAVPHVDMTPWPPLPHIVSICHREGKGGGCLKGHSWQEAAPPCERYHPFLHRGEDRMPRAIEPFAKKLSRLYISPDPKNFPSKLWCFGGFFLMLFVLLLSLW